MGPSQTPGTTVRTPYLFPDPRGMGQTRVQFGVNGRSSCQSTVFHRFASSVLSL